MLIRKGEARSEGIDLALAGLLSLIAGALNAVGFLVAGSFTANMTGNVSLLSEYAARGELRVALSFAGLVLAFTAGAVMAALAVQWGERRGLGAIHALIVGAEGLILLPLGAATLMGTDTGEARLILVLSFALGLQNAVTTLVSGAQVRTTHVSGMVTDVGIELAALTGDAATRRRALPKLRLHALTLASFAAGGVLGVLGYALAGGWLLVAAGAALLAIAGPQAMRARSR